MTREVNTPQMDQFLRSVLQSFVSCQFSIIVVHRQSNFTCTPTIPGCVFTIFKLLLSTFCASMCLAATPWKYQVRKKQIHAVCISFASLEIRVFICTARWVRCSYKEQSLWPAICEVKLAKKICWW